MSDQQTTPPATEQQRQAVRPPAAADSAPMSQQLGHSVSVLGIALVVMAPFGWPLRDGGFWLLGWTLMAAGGLAFVLFASLAFRSRARVIESLLSGKPVRFIPPQQMRRVGPHVAAGVTAIGLAFTLLSFDGAAEDSRVARETSVSANTAAIQARDAAGNSENAAKNSETAALNTTSAIQKSIDAALSADTAADEARRAALQGETASLSADMAAQQGKRAAEQSRDAAMNSLTAAASANEAALQGKDAAGAAKDAADESKIAADSARDAAELGVIAANSASDAADSARDAANAASDAANSADEAARQGQTAAEAAKEAADNSTSAANNAASAARSGRAASVDARQASEDARTAAQNSETAAERTLELITNPVLSTEAEDVIVLPDARSIVAVNDAGQSVYTRFFDGTPITADFVNIDDDIEKEIIVGVGGEGEDAGKVFVFQATTKPTDPGDPWVRYELSTDGIWPQNTLRKYGNLSVSDFSVERIQVAEVNGSQVIVALASDRRSLVSRIVLFNSTGAVIGDYNHAGHVEDFLLQHQNTGSPVLVGWGVDLNIGESLPEHIDRTVQSIFSLELNQLTINTQSPPALLMDWGTCSYLSPRTAISQSIAFENVPVFLAPEVLVGGDPLADLNFGDFGSLPLLTGLEVQLPVDTSGLLSSSSGQCNPVAILNTTVDPDPDWLNWYYYPTPISSEMLVQDNTEKPGSIVVTVCGWLFDVSARGGVSKPLDANPGRCDLSEQRVGFVSAEVASVPVGELVDIDVDLVEIISLSIAVSQAVVHVGEWQLNVATVSRPLEQCTIFPNPVPGQPDIEICLPAGFEFHPLPSGIDLGSVFTALEAGLEGWVASVGARTVSGYVPGEWKYAAVQPDPANPLTLGSSPSSELFRPDIVIENPTAHRIDETHVLIAWNVCNRGPGIVEGDVGYAVTINGTSLDSGNLADIVDLPGSLLIPPDSCVLAQATVTLAPGDTETKVRTAVIVVDDPVIGNAVQETNETNNFSQAVNFL